MAAVGGNQKIALRHRSVGKPDPNAVGVFFAAGNAFTKLHCLPSPEFEHFALQFGAGNRAGASAGARNQRSEAKLSQRLSPQILLVGQKLHRSAVVFDNIAHA